MSQAELRMVLHAQPGPRRSIHKPPYQSLQRKIHDTMFRASTAGARALASLEAMGPAAKQTHAPSLPPDDGEAVGGSFGQGRSMPLKLPTNGIL